MRYIVTILMLISVLPLHAQRRGKLIYHPALNGNGGSFVCEPLGFSCERTEKAYRRAEHHPVKWVFECNRDRCPIEGRLGFWVNLNPDTGLYDECHYGECNAIPGQPKPWCTPAPGQTWFETCVAPTLKKEN